MSWSALEQGAPAIAEAGRRVLIRDGIAQGILATVRRARPPRLHPVYVGFRDGRLLTFIGRSAKLADLEHDGRYALHAHVDPIAPHEFMVRGRARLVEGTDRTAAEQDWPFTPDATYRLFELDVESALLGERPDADAWPPRYVAWQRDGADRR